MVSSSWLTKQRKASLVNLAEEAGLEMYEQQPLIATISHWYLSSDEAWLKPELVDALDEYLQLNETRLSGNEAFDAFYQPRSSRTPHKIRDNSDDGEVKSVVRGRGRRATTSKIKSEPE
jgi:hypothetical protein